MIDFYLFCQVVILFIIYWLWVDSMVISMNRQNGGTDEQCVFPLLMISLSQFTSGLGENVAMRECIVLHSSGDGESQRSPKAIYHVALWAHHHSLRRRPLLHSPPTSWENRAFPRWFWQCCHQWPSWASSWVGNSALWHLSLFWRISGVKWPFCKPMNSPCDPLNRSRVHGSAIPFACESRINNAGIFFIMMSFRYSKSASGSLNKKSHRYSQEDVSSAASGSNVTRSRCSEEKASTSWQECWCILPSFSSPLYL